jgi:hypothetical protein
LASPEKIVPGRVEKKKEETEEDKEKERRARHAVPHGN